MGVSFEKKAIGAIVLETVPYAESEASTIGLVETLFLEQDTLVQLVEEHRILKEAIEHATVRREKTEPLIVDYGTLHSRGSQSLQVSP
ncbi:MAG: hypothetical protein V7703_00075 [Hyphomicrobiales bacterium]